MKVIVLLVLIGLVFKCGTGFDPDSEVSCDGSRRMALVAINIDERKKEEGKSEGIDDAIFPLLIIANGCSRDGKKQGH